MPATLSNFQQQVAAATDFASADYVPVFDDSAGTLKKLSLAVIREEMGGVVATTATELTISAASHAGKTVVISSAAPIAVTLPAATGTGNRYKFVFAVAATATTSSIKCVGTDNMAGALAIYDTSATDIMCLAFAATATDDTIAFDGTTRSGVKGTTVELEDVASGQWAGRVVGPATGSYATPFSATV